MESVHEALRRITVEHAAEDVRPRQSSRSARAHRNSRLGANRTSGWGSVGRWLLCAIDNQNINWPFGRFEFEPQLLPKRRKQRRAIRIDWRWFRRPEWTRSLRCLLRCPREVEIEAAVKSSSINYRAPYKARKCRRECRHVDTRSFNAAWKDVKSTLSRSRRTRRGRGRVILLIDAVRRRLSYL